jgi:hypothetical protein
MSDMAAPAPATARRRAQGNADRLTLVRRVGYAVLGLQLLGFMTWSAILYHRFALTLDFSIEHQAWYLIAHGDLNPYDSPQHIPYWRNHCELIIWPLALLYWAWPHDVILPWIQDAALIGAEFVAFTWVCEIAGRRGRGNAAARLAAVGLVLLVANPWTWAALSFDYHAEPLTVLFLALIAWDTANGRRRAWAWVIPLFACGDVAATWLVGLGLGMALMGRSSRRHGLALACSGLGFALLITLIHANVGSGGGLRAYAYLAGATGSPLTLSALVKGILTHPLISLRTLLEKRTNIWAALGPTGVLGMASPLLLPMAAVILLENNLFHGWLFSAPGFQCLALYALLPVGTVAVLTRLCARHRKTAIALSVLVVAQALAWATIWTPTVPGTWLRVPSGTAATLAAVRAHIPGDAEVIASQGVSGGFSGRKYIEPLISAGHLPIRGQTWFIIVPTAGIESLSTASAMAFISELAGPLGATLVTTANGVWAFRWDTPVGTSSVTVPGGLVPLEAWTSPGAAGRADLAGPVSDWHVSATGSRGYVSDGLAWQVPTGAYRADVTLSASGPVNVEIWDDTNNTLLGRQAIASTDGAQQVEMPVDAPAASASVYSGWGPFRTVPVPPPAAQLLEVRVWSPGGEAVNVYSAELTAVSGPGAGHPDASAAPSSARLPVDRERSYPGVATGAGYQG